MVTLPALKPLPSERFSMFEVGTRTVHNDGHIEVGAAFYSVPYHVVGREVRVHWDGNLVRAYLDRATVAVHWRKEAGFVVHNTRTSPRAQTGAAEAYQL